MIFVKVKKGNKYRFTFLFTEVNVSDMKDDLGQIFNALKKLMKKYEPPLVATLDFDSRYELWSNKEVEIAGRRRPKVHFATIIIQSNYVGFYFMPIYTDSNLRSVFKPELLSLLKGKSCFHIRKFDKKLLGQVEKALEIGFGLYKKRGWI